MISTEVHAQIGGRNVYDFLNLPASARLASLGGINVSTMDDDVSFATQNPALMTDSMHKHVMLSYSGFIADIGYGYAGYSHHWEDLGTFHTAIQYVSYGEMQQADIFGNITGNFTPGDLVWMAGYAKSFGQFQGGVNLKVIQSTLAPGYSSVGLASDWGFSYRNKEGLLSIGLVVRNLGTQLSTYTDEQSPGTLPLDVAIGISNKLKYMPLRFSITINNLQTPDLIVEDPNAAPEIDLEGNEIREENSFAEKVFRHFVFSGEFLLGNAVRLRVGYNHLRRQELRSVNRGGMSGFSLGLGLRISRVSFDYGFASYGPQSLFNAHQFGLMLNLSRAK